MNYVDGYLIPVPASNKESYREMARQAAVIFKEFGATRVVECWGDDVPEGKVTDFKRAAKVEGEEVVVFSWVEYPSKSVRDTANRRMREDPRMKELGSPMPFDDTRMSFGGFVPILDTDGESK
ncbi:MAG: DUF1428 domain-containing protein [Gemmatimonadota bacterium]